MKKIIVYISLILWLSNCNKNNQQDIGNVKVPIENLVLAKEACNSEVPWLLEIIAKANEDNATKKYLGAYLGTIYLTTYKNSPVFVINMMLNSGGVMFHAFDCNNLVLPLTNSEAIVFYEEIKTKGKIIYSNAP